MNNFASDKQPKRSSIWVILLLVAGVLLTVFCLWWFQSSQLKDFIDDKDDAAFFQSQTIDSLLQPYLKQLGPALEDQRTLIHFWRPDCLCNRISQRHFENLIAQYSADELRIVIIAHPATSDAEIASLIKLNGERFIVLRAQQSLLDLLSSPSLAIYNQYGEFSYFGAYGFGAFCNVREDGFLASIIDNAQGNRFTNVIGEGCFCRWSDE